MKEKGISKRKTEINCFYKFFVRFAQFVRLVFVHYLLKMLVS